MVRPDRELVPRRLNEAVLELPPAAFVGASSEALAPGDVIEWADEAPAAMPHRSERTDAFRRGLDLMQR